MAKYASEMVKLMQSWVGKKESDGSYKEIIDIYNSIEHKRGPMSYDWEWCAATVSAAAIKLGYTDIIPIEMSTNNQIKIAKEMGIWKEDESVVPQPGWLVFYDWDDNGVGNNKGEVEHVGLVEKVSGNEFEVIEGNYDNAVKRRKLKVNGKYLRGFAAPKYDPENETIKVLPVKHIPEKMGVYRCTGNLVLRAGASTKNKKLETMPKDSRVTCWGVYSLNGKTIWLLVAAESGLVGWCSTKYLEKV